MTDRSCEGDHETHASPLTRARVEGELRADETRRLAHLKQHESAARGVPLERTRNIEPLPVVLEHRYDRTPILVHVYRTIRRTSGIHRVSCVLLIHCTPH